jgi:RNA polymerase sigma-70 factor (ECF subfamily)
MHRLARSLVRDEHLAADVAQETLLAGLSSAPPQSAEPSAAVPRRGWLFGIARRVAADVHRGQHRRDRKHDALPSPAAAPPLDDALARSEAAELVRSFLERLDEGHRMVFVLADIEGMTAPEIADALELKVNTVYSRLRKARLDFERIVARREARAEKEQVLHG